MSNTFEQPFIGSGNIHKEAILFLGEEIDSIYKELDDLDTKIKKMKESRQVLLIKKKTLEDAVLALANYNLVKTKSEAEPSKISI